MRIHDFATGNPDEPYNVGAIHQAYANSVGWDGVSFLSFNDLPEPYAALKKEAMQRNDDAHIARMEQLAKHPIPLLTEWEQRGSKNGE